MTVAGPFDAAGRLAEGRPAVDDVEEYVAACQRLGYRHRDLTAHAAQAVRWYDSEEGLDLRALDADCAALSAAAAAALDACRMQTDLVAQTSGAWAGMGSSVAREFLWRNSEAATSVGMSLESAADAAATLRDALWRAVDAKVTAVETIDARHRPQRADWLAAARTVTSGAGDLAAASELVDQQVKPFVQSDIESDWLAAMRAAVASINAAYASAISRLAGVRVAVFEVPGELGPRAVWGAPGPAGGAGESSAPVQTTPAAAVASVPLPVATPVTGVDGPPTAPWTGPSAVGPSPMGDPGLQPMSPPTTMPQAAVPSVPPVPSAPFLPSAGDLGAGTSSLGGGLSGFGQQLADLIGGLIGSSDDASSEVADPAESSGADDPEDDPGDPDDPDDPDDPEHGPDDGLPGEPPPHEEPAVTEAAQAAAGGCEPEPESWAEPEPEPEPVPTPVPPPPVSPPVAQAMPDAIADTAAATPCEIAADELPQVGE
jgi:hypothetical protein